MAAAAWADGVIQLEEARLIGAFIEEYAAGDRSAISDAESYLGLQIDEDERLLLVDDLLTHLKSDDDRRFAMKSIKSVFDADGLLSEEEMAVICQIQKVIVGGQAAFDEEFSKLTGSKPTKETVSAYDLLSNWLEQREITLEGHEDDLRRLVLSGYWMARIASADGDVDDMEIAVMKDSLVRKWGLDRAASDFVTEIASSLEYEDIDENEAAREFLAITHHSDRLVLADMLVALCMADGHVDDRELETLHSICDLFKFKAEDVRPILNRINRQHW